ncbi:MAG: hypothetical protein R2793_09845 [Flavobacteriaceae bacterium]
MKRLIKHILFLCCLISTLTIHAQISPGDLTTSHSNLEGMSNCTQCHIIGEKVSNDKCLSCHKEIKSLMNQKKGFHSSSQVLKKDCFSCHSEHHGRKFDMIHFDENNFNHTLAGYELEGKHGQIDCKACHKPDFISNSDQKKRKGTFLGLSQECLACHDDFHQKTLGNDCLSCHNMESFSPASKFNHDKTAFALEGKHTEVDCKECHKTTIKNGKEFQEFSGIAFSDCKSCHNDPHNNQLKGSCTQCHTVFSFNQFNGKGRFNHNTTGFALKGSHKAVDCFSCHTKSNNPLTVFQDKLSFEENNCIACHEDFHEGKYGNDCAKCHNETSFLALNNMDFFDHSVTDYPLEGNHLGVDCRKCHIERFSTPIDFSACKNCHDDYHNGEFSENGFSPDCLECHSLEKGFDYSLYTLEQHQTTPFPLEGAHIATPCFACHVSEDDDRWTFRNIGTSCVDCHLDFHEGFIDQKYYASESCESCHNNDSWVSVDFDHTKTQWPLTGQHTKTQCSACHFTFSEKGDIISQKFSNLDTNCAACHENVHEDLFAINGVTDCNRCHVTDSWFPKKFNHNETRFPLEGKHAEIDCKECHEIKNDVGETSIIYQLNKLECIDCHLQ